CERSGDDIYNTAVAVGSEGVIAHYRKLHLFDVEKHCFTPGDTGLSVVDTDYGTIGLCICYDLRFVEVVRVLALRGADLICVPTAWVRGFDRRQYREGELIAHAEGALVQANLSQVFIACTSQAGAGDGVELLGSSVVADPYGRMAGGPLSTEREQLEIVDVDLAEARRAQDRSELIRPRADRRTDVYGILHDGDSL
ncbi:MAG: hydratase, partial [Acidimicrobiaceae bacterium]|nr:hydratase [Acidimicrobiaceae bacterium]